MHRNGSCPGLFRNMCHLYCIDMGIIKALSDFYRQRLLYGFCCFFDDFTCQNRIFHQCRAVTIIDYLWHRTSHIDVKNIKRSMLDTLCHLAHNFRVGAKKLQGNRMFPLINGKQAFGILIIIINAFSTDHFHADKSCSLLFAKYTKWQVCYPCHWC